MEKFWEPDSLNEILQELNEELRGKDVVLTPEEERKGNRETRGIFGEALKLAVKAEAREQSSPQASASRTASILGSITVEPISFIAGDEFVREISKKFARISREYMHSSNLLSPTKFVGTEWVSYLGGNIPEGNKEPFEKWIIHVNYPHKGSFYVKRHSIPGGPIFRGLIIVSPKWGEKFVGLTTESFEFSFREREFGWERANFGSNCWSQWLWKEYFHKQANREESDT